jgi:hypothetical protein
MITPHIETDSAYTGNILRPIFTHQAIELMSSIRNPHHQNLRWETLATINNLESLGFVARETRWEGKDAVILKLDTYESIVLLSLSPPHDVDIEIVGPQSMVPHVGDFLLKYLPRVELSKQRQVSMKFWSLHPKHGPTYTPRHMDVPAWSDIDINYPTITQHALRRVVQWETVPPGGKLMLWHGRPGVGKTYAIRTLAWEWRSWASFEYVVDPDKLFHEASYLISVILDQGDNSKGTPWDMYKNRGNRWRVLLLEDTGELLTLDAKKESGQGLSRLLNVVDGLIGQGQRVMILITTNEEIGVLHPAVIRPGRCVANIEFESFSPLDIQRWQQAHNTQVSGVGARPTLAELYAAAENRLNSGKDRRVGFGHGAGAAIP